jgi:hypothetical protein
MTTIHTRGICWCSNEDATCAEPFDPDGEDFRAGFGEADDGQVVGACFFPLGF